MKILLVLISTLLLAGCAVHTPRGSVSIGTGWGYYGGYSYHDHYSDDNWGYRGDYHRASRFCPPGQAKKGRC